VSSTGEIPVFLAGVQDGWHAIPPEGIMRGCDGHAWSACGLIVRVARDDSGEPRSWQPGEPPQSCRPCPACFWTAAAKTGQLDAALETLNDPLARATAAAVVAGSGWFLAGDWDDSSGLQLLAAVTRHAPAELVSEGCAEGDCDHDGRCPARTACPACSLQAGSWAGEWEGQFRDECTILAPCAVLLAIADHFGVTAPAAAPGDISVREACALAIRRHAAERDGIPGQAAGREQAAAFILPAAPEAPGG
jgi:hypothetical protein